MKLHDRRFKSGHYDYNGSIDSDNSLNSFSSTEDILKNFSTCRNDSRRKNRSDTGIEFDGVQSLEGIFDEAQ